MHWLLVSLGQKLFGRGARKTRRLEVCYAITLTNPSPVSARVTLVIPEPLLSTVQPLQSPIAYSEPVHATGQDARLGNRFVYWHKELLPGQTETLSQNYTIQTQPTDRWEGNEQRVDLFEVASEREHFLTITEHLIADHPKLTELVQRTAPKIAGKTINEVIKILSDTVQEVLTYERPIPGLYTAKEALETGRVDCGGFDTLFVSLCIAHGIPARVVCGFWTDSIDAMHAWAEAMLPDGTWIPVDPSVEYLRERGRTNRLGKVGYVGSDRIIYSVGCDLVIDIDGTSHPIDILQTPMLFPKETPLTMTYTFSTKEV